MIQGYQQQIRVDYEQQLKVAQFTAWHVAAYVGASFGGGKLPDINDILNKPLFDNNKVIQPIVELTEEQKYEQGRNFALSCIRQGLSVSEKVKTKYNIK
jgi:hypothetical protein